MSNRDTYAARNYHQRTKHSLLSVQTGQHYLDWSDEPLPFKIYTDLPGQRLPGDLPTGDGPALAAIGATTPVAPCVPTLPELARLLHYAAGITKRGVLPGGGNIYFRAASCTGALYHIELYVVCGDLPGLAAGVYHFGPHDFSLRQLRAGDHRAILAAASGGEPAAASAPAIIATTSVFWRNAWKYQARAYRHCYWDSGVMLANLLAAGAARQLPLKVAACFADAPVNHLLGVDGQQEVALQLVAVGHQPGDSLPPAPDAPPLNLAVRPYSRHPVDYPLMRETHAASSLADPAEARELRGAAPPLRQPEPAGPLFPLAPLPEASWPAEPIEQVILRRGSSRRFRRAAIGFDQLSTLLRRATQPIAADFLDGATATLTQPYLVVNDVAGLPPGAYVYRPERDALEQLRAGDSRAEAGQLALGQELGADASVCVYFLADLEAALARYGNRGYRLAQTEAAIRGGFLYLGAYALRLGASGLTFFDDDVTAFFSPHAAGKSVMFLTAVGRPLRRRRLSQ